MWYTEATKASKHNKDDRQLWYRIGACCGNGVCRERVAQYTCKGRMFEWRPSKEDHMGPGVCIVLLTFT